jgi:hypothetical protein
MLQPTDDAEGLVRFPRAKHTRATRTLSHARTHSLTRTAAHTRTAAVADGLRAPQPLAEPSAPEALTQAAREEFNKKLDFVTDFEMRAEQLRLNVDEPIYDIAERYLKVARSSPCFVRLLAATGPALCHGRCARTAG